MKLTPLQQGVLSEIQRYYPVSYQEVVKAFDLTKSFDDTVLLLEHSNCLGCAIEDIYKIVEQYHHEKNNPCHLR